jgi:hypothetical protein
MQHPGPVMITMPNSAVTIGDYAFADCTNLVGIYFQGDAPLVGSSTFLKDKALMVYYLPGTAGWGTTFGGRPAAPWPFPGFRYTATNGTITIKAYTGTASVVTIPLSFAGLPVTRIGTDAFLGCGNVTTLTISGNITNIGTTAFTSCTNLAHIYFKGNAPVFDGSAVFSGVDATIYYLPATTGWDSFPYLPTVLWSPRAKSDANFGVRNGRFGFDFTNGGETICVLIEACTNLAGNVWSPVATQTLTGGSSTFSDPVWTNYPTRFYRFQMP